MFKLLDKAFWRFAMGFVLILIVSFSILTISGAWREMEGNFAALLTAFHLDK